MKGSGLFDVSAAPAARGEDKGPFCSIQCRHRSEWYRGILGRDGEGEMLEDVEERRKNVARSTQELVERKAKEDAAAAAAAAATRPPPHAQDAKSTTFANDLLASLTIHEKPILSTPPVAPSLSSTSRDFERPSQRSANPSSRFPANPSSSATSRPLSSPAAALLPFSASSTRSLTRTVLSSTRSLRPPPSTRQPTSGPNGLPPIRFLTGPRMVDEQGMEVEWVGVDEEGEDEVTRGWMDEALEIRRMVERGEL
ncbi:hypothetical protein JCM1841_004652 [Sporobolomyces salmonicolor]